MVFSWTVRWWSLGIAMFELSTGGVIAEVLNSLTFDSADTLLLVRMVLDPILVFATLCSWYTVVKDAFA